MSMKPNFQVVVGSTNPVKVQAIADALAQTWPERDWQVQGMAAPSGVAAQPMTPQETKQGAINRVRYCQSHYPADFYAAIEGGLEVNEDGVFTFAYVVIANAEHCQVGRSTALPLPPQVAERLSTGVELGLVMDELFNTDNIKQKGGAIGLLTNHLATRGSVYLQAAILTLAPFRFPELYR